MDNNSIKYDAIFLDRDGTLNPDPGYISSVKDFSLYPFTISALRKLSSLTNHLCIVTNQSGVSRGLIEENELEKIHSYLIESLENENISISGLYVCIDLPEANSKRRKPHPGMFIEAAENLSLSLDRCLMIGDSVHDILAGNRLNMETMLVLTGHGHKTVKKYASEINATFTVKDLMKGAEMLLELQNK